MFSAKYYCIAFVYRARAAVFYNGDPLISETKLPGFDYLPRRDSGSTTCSSTGALFLCIRATFHSTASNDRSVINPAGRFCSFDFRDCNRDRNLDQTVWLLALHPLRPPAGPSTYRPACVDKGPDKIGITFRDTHVQTY